MDNTDRIPVPTTEENNPSAQEEAEEQQRSAEVFDNQRTNRNVADCRKLPWPLKRGHRCLQLASGLYEWRTQRRAPVLFQWLPHLSKLSGVRAS